MHEHRVLITLYGFHMSLWYLNSVEIEKKSTQKNYRARRKMKWNVFVLFEIRFTTFYFPFSK